MILSSVNRKFPLQFFEDIYEFHLYLKNSAKVFSFYLLNIHLLPRIIKKIFTKNFVLHLNHYKRYIYKYKLANIRIFIFFSHLLLLQ